MEDRSIDEIQEHIEFKIEEFKKEILTIALENKYPFISSILFKAQMDFQKSAETKIGTIFGDENKFL